MIASLGADPAVAVPLLLGNAFHGRVDVPAALGDALAHHPHARLSLGAVLGPDRLLLAPLDRRLAGAGAGPADAVVLASAGTSDPAARAALARLARGWRRGSPVVLGFAAGPGPRVGEAVEALRAAGAARVAVASWFLAPGLLYDRARADALAAGADVVAGALGPAPEVTGLVLARYDALARRHSRRAA